MRRPVLAVGVAGLVLGVAAEDVAFGWSDPGHWIPDLLTGWTLIGCGLIAWTRRPESRTGPLLAATGVTWFFGNFVAVGGAIVVSYGVAVVPEIWSNETASVALALLLVGVTAIGYVRSVGQDRRARGIALRIAVGLGVVIVAGSLARLLLPGPETVTVALLAYETTLCAVAIAMTVGLLSASWERAAVTDLVVELGGARSGTLREELARALGDPSLEVGYWRPDAGAFADAQGREVILPPAGSDRAATIVEREHEPVAVLIHDPAVLQDPGLMEALTSAARLEAANARLQGSVHARVVEIEASRRRVLAAGDEERRRLERRLRDGAERRLGDLGDVLAGTRESSGTRECRN
jgi:hypothetical protein